LARTVRKNWRYVLVVIASLALLAWFIANLEWAEVWRALAEVRLRWLAAAVVVVVLDFYARAVRWAVVVHHFDPRTPIRTFWRATTIGNALNTVLPLRAGDVVRPMIVARRHNLPLATVFSTVVVERMFDAVGLIGAAAIVLVLLDGKSAAAVAQVVAWGKPALLTMAVGLAVVLALGSRRARVVAKAVLSRFPTRLRARPYRAYLQIAAGMAPAYSPRRLIQGLAATFVVWALTTLTIELVLRSMGIHLPIAASVFAAMALTVSVSVPQAPGYLGLFQVALYETLSLWSDSLADAQAAALVLWAVYVLPITAVGLVHAWLEAAELSGIRAQLRGQAPADAGETSGDGGGA